MPGKRPADESSLGPACRGQTVSGSSAHLGGEVFTVTDQLAKITAACHHFLLCHGKWLSVTRLFHVLSIPVIGMDFLL